MLVSVGSVVVFFTHVRREYHIVKMKESHILTSRAALTHAEVALSVCVFPWMVPVLQSTWNRHGSVSKQLSQAASTSSRLARLEWTSQAHRARPQRCQYRCDRTAQAPPGASHESLSRTLARCCDT